MNGFSIVFVLALAATTATRLWLAFRHVRHVQAHRERVPEAFAADIDLEAHRKAADYTSAKTRLSAAAIAFDAAVLLALTFGGILQWLDGLAAALFQNDILRGTAFVALLVVLTSMLELPFGLYRTFVIETRFGFNKMTLGMWIADLVKHAAVGAVLGLPLVLAVLWLMERMGELWWFYVWLVWIGFSTLLLAVYPAFIAPLFNRFSPMQEGETKRRIEKLIERCGFTSKGLFVMDGSKRSTHGNAYFTGFGKSKRIVFFDTLLNRLEAPEIEAVLAHELGHFRRRHVFKRLAWTFAASLVLLAVLGALMDQPWFFVGLGVAYPATDAMALALFFLVVPVFVFPLQPLMAMYSRKHEFEADEYAAQYTPARDLIRALVKLYKDNASTLTPDPLHSAWYDSHPPAATRILRLQQMAQA
ncbi:MAG TPA: M48 family metallopeptidase [Burkholderiales bacterium]|jgi:STE24 endopeptidase|nr:M48 family metallopeptidase [Burkholderiales bacterium]